MPSIKKNFAFNLVLTVSTYLFSLIVFPYVSRVLGVELIGRVSFAEQTMRYFSLLATMGVAAVGIREISYCGDDRHRRSEVFSNIFAFILLLTTVSVVLSLVAAFAVPHFSSIRNLLVIGSAGIFFTTLMIEWFYQGLENFRFVTIRTIAVKCLYVAAIFLLVREKDDYWLYYAINVACTTVNACINLAYSRHFVDFSFKGVSLKTYAKPILSLGFYMLMLSFFTTFNVVYLGFVQTEYQTGLYAASIKIYSILLAVISAFTGVMMPRMCSLLSENKTGEYEEKVHLSWELVFAVALPVAIGCAVMAPQIISLLSGDEFLEAVLPMRIIMTNLVICSAAQICVMQTLLPMKQDGIVIKSSVVAAIIGVILNIVLVGRLGAVGSAMVLVCAEIAGDSISFVYALQKRLIVFPLRMFLKHILCSLPYLLICLSFSMIFESSILALGLALFVCLAYFVFLNGIVFKTSGIHSVLLSVIR